MRAGVSKPKSMTGFTLLEALVALVVISIGLLGVLGLQTVAVVNTQTSEAKSLASIAADNIADRIRANPSGAEAGYYSANPDPDDVGPAAMPSTDCLQTLCTNEQMAELDIWEWENTIQTVLNGKGYLECAQPATPSPSDPCRAYTITVAWTERQAPQYSGEPVADNDRCDDTPDRFQRRCFITVIRP